jgi:two-component system phosphate regulon response regulator PhoB
MARVLIVDDDAFIRELILMKLRNAGFDAHAETDGEAALAAAIADPPDVILADWMMPRLTGPELCARLRERPETVNVPILLITAKAQDADIQRGFAAGADDYILKPFSPRELVARVQAVIDRGR